VPELPEVETLCRQLREVILGEPVCGMEVLDSRLGALPDTTGSTVREVYRSGKEIRIGLDDCRTIAVHLRMTGRLLWDGGQGMRWRTRMRLTFSCGTVSLIDVRRFATVRVHDDTCGQAEGIDPFGPCAVEELAALSDRHRIPVKSFLTNQRCMSGIGNIYACEILFGAAIDPWRPSCDISVPEWEHITRVGQDVLARAIVCRGTTISDWRDLYGREGEYQQYLLVYRRAGEHCPRCGATLRREKLGGSGAYFCAQCQT
jgi:formamidopyrimidine-DNA glycosylase